MIEILLSLLLAATGIGRTVDPGLVSVAEQRVVEIQTNFSHEGMQTPEILAWNAYADPEGSVNRVVDQWMESPDHYAILMDPSLTRIGCAMSVKDGIYWYACAFGTSTVAQPTVNSAPSGEGTPETVTDRVPLLPDTAMGE